MYSLAYLPDALLAEIIDNLTYVFIKRLIVDDNKLNKYIEQKKPFTRNVIIKKKELFFDGDLGYKLLHNVRNPELTKTYLEMGANPDFEYMYGGGAIHSACGGDYRESLELLIYYGANINQEHRRRDPPIAYAFIYDSDRSEIIKILLKHKCNINYVNICSKTIIDHLVDHEYSNMDEKCKEKILNLLIENGLDINHENLVCLRKGSLSDIKYAPVIPPIIKCLEDKHEYLAKILLKNNCYIDVMKYTFFLKTFKKSLSRRRCSFKDTKTIKQIYKEKLEFYQRMIDNFVRENYSLLDSSIVNFHIQKQDFIVEAPSSDEDSTG